MEQAEEREKIKVRYLVSINRQAPVEDAKASVEAMRVVNSPYVVGVELSGNPKTGNFNDFKPLFDEIREKENLKISLHCAETEDQVAES